ncbi:MAG: copper amine oxidase N-terminal domain-containing protein [Peptostreptococcaceae bacterium]|nr:copper amine oxidase N-terminal domain-containing protein [Peptostreptococcaceae bacterium]
MKILKKQFSVLMTLLMILSLVPLTAFADEYPQISLIGQAQTFTTADKDKEVRFKVDLSRYFDLKMGRVIFELENAKLATVAGAAKATVVQGDTNLMDPDVVFSAPGGALAGGEKLFNLDINKEVKANNKDNIEVIVSLRLDFSESVPGEMNVVLRDIGKDGVPTGIGDHKLMPTTGQTAAKDIELKVDKPDTKIGPAGGALSSVIVLELKKLSATTSENKLVVSLPSGFLFSPASKVTTDGAAPTVAYSADKNEMTITGITRNTAYVKVEPMVVLKASGSAANGKIMAGFELRVNNKKVSEKDAVIGELVSYGLTVTAVEKGKREIPMLVKGMPKAVEVTIKAVDGTLTNGATIDLDVDGAEIVYNTLKVVEPTGLILTAPKSAGSKDADKVSGYEVYADSKFALRTHKYDVQNIKLSFDIVASPKAEKNATLMVSTSRVDDQKIDIAKVSKTVDVQIVAAQVDKGVKADLPKVVIKEVEKNLLQNGDKIYLELIYPGSEKDKGQHVAFNSAKEIKVETTNSLKIDSVELGKQENILVLTVGSRSFEGPGMITLTGIRGFLTEKAPMNQVDLQVRINDNIESVTPFFSVGTAVSLKTVFAINNKTYTVNGQMRTLQTAPYINNGRTMLPVRAVGESLGLQASWDNATKTATFMNDSKTAIVKIGQSTISVNNTPLPLTVPAEIKDGSTMIELRSLASAFGVNIHWDAATKTVTVN